MFKQLTETKTVKVELNQAEVLELAKTERIATISETVNSKVDGWFWTSTWIDYDGEDATAYHLHAPDDKIKFKLPLKDGTCDIPELDLKDIYLWRIKKYSGLLRRGGGDGRQYVYANGRPSYRDGVLVKEG